MIYSEKTSTDLNIYKLCMYITYVRIGTWQCRFTFHLLINYAFVTQSNVMSPEKILFQCWKWRIVSDLIRVWSQDL